MRITRTCPQCGHEYEAYAYKTRPNGKKFCSRSCAQIHSNLRRDWTSHKLTTLAHQTKEFELNPSKRLARKLARAAVKLGLIELGPCVVCGDVNAEIHHPDYSRPFYVVPLCKKDHGKMSRKESR
jgi:endogenous inhibitor of DNA gyrase (YacG/DUF329 family)